MKLILKGILLYSTTLYILLVCCSIDWLFDNYRLLQAIIIGISLILINIIILSKKDLYKLCFLEPYKDTKI